MIYQYKIADVSFRLDTTEALIEDWQASLFHNDEDEEADITCHMSITDKLPDVSGKQLLSLRDTRLFLDGRDLWQETFNRKDGKALIRVRYSTEGNRDIYYYGLNTVMPYPVRSWMIWPAIDLPYLLMQYGKVTLHSSSIDHGGKAILFIASSGTGKSTQARLWNEHRGVRQLNGDKNLVGMKHGIACAFGTPFSGTSEICTDYALPLEAIVLLGQAPKNRIKRVTGILALMEIMKNSFGHKAVPGCLDQMTAILSDVISSVPVYKLDCTPDEEAVLCLESVL